MACGAGGVRGLHPVEGQAQPVPPGEHAPQLHCTNREALKKGSVMEFFRKGSDPPPPLILSYGTVDTHDFGHTKYDF